MAAHRASLKTVIIPERNLKDLVDVPKSVKTDMKIVTVKHMDEVLGIALRAEPVVEPPRPRKRQEELGQGESDE
jgi:ATP-dependent Lon protease